MDFHELRGAGGRVDLEAAALGPGVGGVVVADQARRVSGPRLRRTMRRSRVTRAVQKSRSRERSTRWSWRPGAVGSTWRSKAACFAAAFSWAARRSRAAVKVSAMRRVIEGKYS
jgi:hypothetical protein